VPEITVEMFLYCEDNYVQHYVDLIQANRSFFNRLFAYLSDDDLQRAMTSQDAQATLKDGRDVLHPMCVLQPRLEGERWFARHLAQAKTRGVHERHNQAIGAVVKFLMGLLGHTSVPRSPGESRSEELPLNGRSPNWSMQSSIVYHL
jgi:hypothetical protein